MERYRTYAAYLKEIYGTRVYKLPVNLPLTCPNRDGCLGVGGCTFCGAHGAAYEALPDTLSVTEQLRKNRDYIGQKYKATRFIAYFQNYSNTYLPPATFRQMLEEAAKQPEIVEIAISTRPDCINNIYLSALKDICRQYGINCSLELGLQTANYHTLQAMNRGHTLAEFIDAVLAAHRFDIPVCAHVILNLPGDTDVDVAETAKILSSLHVEQAKLHSLYIVKGTPLASAYEAGAFSMGQWQDYMRKVILFLETINPEMVIQRLIGRAKENDVVFANYGTSWWKIKDAIDAEMERQNTWQGKRCDYLDGKAVRKFINTGNN